MYLARDHHTGDLFVSIDDETPEEFVKRLHNLCYEPATTDFVFEVYETKFLTKFHTFNDLQIAQV